MDQRVLLQTADSFLATYTVGEPDMIEQCVAEVKGQLVQRPEFILYDKVCHQNRNLAFFSNTSSGYKYSTYLAKSIPLTPSLEKLLALVNAYHHTEFNGILVNEYVNGSDYIGPHSDEERCLDKIGVVAVSYGASRLFRIRDKKTKQIVLDLNTESGQFIQMGGKFQNEFTHEIPIQKKIQGTRVSFTFRKHRY
jgi:alkylated DNA repair dioxygenase AlkB